MLCFSVFAVLFGTLVFPACVLVSPCLFLCFDEQTLKKLVIVRTLESGLDFATHLATQRINAAVAE